MNIDVMLDSCAKMPTKAHKSDAGYDIYAPCSISVLAHGNAVIDTGVHMIIPEGFVGMVKSKSGLNTMKDLTCEGVVDAGYTGSIVVKMYNNGNNDYHFNKGDKLTQIVIMPIPNTELRQVYSLPNTERGANGFGSTGV